MKYLLPALVAFGMAGCGSLMEPPTPQPLEVHKPVTQDWRFHEHRLLDPITREKLAIWETCAPTFPPRSTLTLYLCVWALKPHQ